MVVLSALIGSYIRNKIWGISNKPNNPFEYGRAAAAYIAFIVPMSSIFLFIKKDLINALIDNNFDYIVSSNFYFR